MRGLNLKAVRAAPPRFEHGFEAPQASVISKLHYRATSPHRPPQYKREGEHLAGEARVHWRRRCARGMAVEIQRKVEFSMIDMANVAYYPRIFDLAHKVFEQAWEAMCDVSYPSLVNERRVGFPVVSLTSTFHAPLRYGDTITASVAISSIGTTSLAWTYTFVNQHGETVWTSQQATVCVDMNTMEKQPIPDDLRPGLNQHLEEATS